MNKYDDATWDSMAKNITSVKSHTDRGPGIIFRPIGQTDGL